MEFDIDTGRAQLVCCPNPSYGLHESEIMREQLAVLKKRGWIMRYEEGAWGSVYDQTKGLSDANLLFRKILSIKSWCITIVSAFMRISVRFKSDII